MEIRSLLVLKLQTPISPGMKRRGDKPNKLLISVFVNISIFVINTRYF